MRGPNAANEWHDYCFDYFHSISSAYESPEDFAAWYFQDWRNETHSTELKNRTI